MKKLPRSPFRQWSTSVDRGIRPSASSKLTWERGQPAHDSLHRWQRFDGGRLTPRLVGFLSTPERDFFELFCSVDGVGVKKALRAMTQPVQDTAIMIEQQDAKGALWLPGVGPATAERIIAKLRRKMPKFALLVRRELQPEKNCRRSRRRYFTAR